MSEILVEVSRGDIIECVHRGNIAIVDNNNKLIHSAGDPEKVTYMRSATKPLQSLNVILSGAAESIIYQMMKFQLCALRIMRKTFICRH